MSGFVDEFTCQLFCGACCDVCFDACCDDSSTEPEHPGGQPLRIVILGRSQVGKSATGNTILGRKAFMSEHTSNTITSQCQRKDTLNNREIYVVDTPGFLDTRADPDHFKKEILRCMKLSSPGPHVFLLVMALNHITRSDQQSIKALQELFGSNISEFIIVVFTHADELGTKTIEEYINGANKKLQKAMQSCGGRYVTLKNKDRHNHGQVMALLKKIDEMIASNAGAHFRDDMYKEVEQTLKQQTVGRLAAETMEYDFSFIGSLSQRIARFQSVLAQE